MGTDIHGVLQEQINGVWETIEQIPNDRNYTLFAALAGVRNGYGFAGVPLHTPITPISEPRGLPECFVYDEDAAYEDEDAFWLGDYDFTWLTLREVLTWDGWEKSTRHVGFIRRDEYAAWLEHQGQPRGGWSGGVSGYKVIQANHATGYFPKDWTHVHVSWGEKLADSCKHFLSWANEVTARLQTDDLDKARIVIGFDS